MTKENEKQPNFANDEEILKKKIQQVKVEFNECPKTKSGKNKFQNFNYFELKDIVPLLEPLLIKYNLSGEFDFEEKGIAKYVISDNETGTTKTWVTRYPVVNTYKRLKKVADDDLDKTVNKFLQMEGKIETYCRRYLLLQAFNIAENDAVDATNNGNKQQQQKTQKKSKPLTNPKGEMTIYGVKHHMEEEEITEKEDIKKELASLLEQKLINQVVFNKSWDDLVGDEK